MGLGKEEKAMRRGSAGRVAEVGWMVRVEMACAQDTGRLPWEGLEVDCGRERRDAVHGHNRQIVMFQVCEREDKGGNE